MAETANEMLARITMMADGDPKWDLSDNDRVAIAYAVAEVFRLRASVKPFADAAKTFDSWDGPGTEQFPLRLEHADGGEEFQCTIGDLRRARDALQ